MLDVLVVHLLEVGFAVLLEVFAESFLHGFLEGFDAVAACVAHTHLGVLAFLAALLSELLAALLGEGWYADAYDLAVVLGHNAKFAVDDGFLDDFEHGLVPGLDGDGAGVGCGDGGAVVDGHHGAVVIYAYAVEEFDVRFSSADV